MFALVEEKGAKLRGEVQGNLDEAKMELHTEINDLRTEMEGGEQERREVRQKVEFLSLNPPMCPCLTPSCSAYPPSCIMCKGV